MLGATRVRWLQGSLLAIIGLAALQVVAAAAEPGYPAFPMPETPLTLRAQATSRRFISAHGRRAMVVGYAAESLEGWIFPFRIFHDFRIGFRVEGSTEVIPGSALMREVIVNPESTTRVYSAQKFTVRETAFVPLEEPGFVILYQVRSRAPLHVVLSFRPDLDLMWPGGIGGQSYTWDERRRALVLQESSEKYLALVGSPLEGLHSQPADYAKPWNADRRLSLELDVPAGSERVYPLVVSCTIPGHYDADKTYRKLLEQTPQLYAQAVEHYRKLISSNMQVETPDRETNLAYTWALVTLDQAYVCNPHLGCGLIAGYGPSRDTRRPQFAWFFGGDAMINTFALEAAGNHALAREAMRFIQKYQKSDTGEVFHEISQSAGLIDWFKDYLYAYRHTDASAMYLVAFRNLYRASGDLEFLRASWDSLRAAYRYLVSRTDLADGFVTVPVSGWGGDETIGEQVLKDVYLESLWVAGADSLSELATLMGDSQSASDARTRAEKARASLAARLWNSARSFFFYGFNARGELLTQELSQPNWGIWLGAIEADQSQRALNQMARARWQADWGLRSVPVDDPLYIHDSYGHGSVWPVGTGVQALAFYRHHRPLQGFSLHHSLVEQSFLNSPGRVTEVFSGDLYRELDVSVPEQIWSSGMVITTLVRGLLGLTVNAPGRQVTFSPHLPPDWSTVKIRNLKVGESTLNLEMEQSETEVKLRVENPHSPVQIEFSPEVPLGIRSLRASLNGKPLSVALKAQWHDVHAEMNFSVEGKAEVTLSYEPGVRPWLPPARPRIGDMSRGLRVLSSKLEGRIYRAELEGVPDACSPLVLFTPWNVKQVMGGRVSRREGNRWNFAASPAPEACSSDSSSSEAYQTWTFQVEFEP